MSKWKAYRVILVTGEDVDNGVVKDATVYLHSQVEDSPFFYFTDTPGGEDGFPLLMSQVERLAALDSDGSEQGTETPTESVPVSEPMQLPLYTEAEPNERGAGLKFDSGKPRASLLFRGMPLALGRVIDVLTFGAKKYSAHSWQQVENGLERYEDAKLRHMLKDATGEELDPETGIEHLAHEACNILFLLELKLREKARGAE